MEEVLICTKKNRKKKKGKEKGSNIPKSCLKSSPGAVTAQDASPEHNHMSKTITHHLTIACAGVIVNCLARCYMLPQQNATKTDSH
ncbi:hypothetical protein J6590_093201 [Homalodisca vitripennis]|nr:hypothetical protein J6590_019535 [Homalodisca vitripennis]KAG8275136.1 hypothetical protein J6590_093201 [Homalodisca vitripennis]